MKIRNTRLVTAWVGTIALAALLAQPADASPKWTQTFDLVPGWNAIYLHIQPDETEPSRVFENVDVLSAWTRGVEPNSVDFICRDQPGCP
ncbi:MAG: hypothetical protein ACRERC_15510, partial [Candidatus Binatia bacterium]